MEKEISSGAMLGIVLIALAAVIGLGFGVFAIARGTANEGVGNVQESLQTVSQSQFLDFDQKVVTGTQVLSALQGFEGMNIAVLIETAAFRNGQTVLAGHSAPMVTSTTNVIPPTPAAIPTTLAGVTGTFINYNAMLALNTAGALPPLITPAGGAKPATGVPSPPLHLLNGVQTAPFGFATTAGVVQFNSIIGGLHQTGNAEFVAPTARFQANLIRDRSGTIMGVTFRQI